MDNIRNRQAGHIAIDYRIACAMNNFVHKPCCPDEANATEIAERIKLKTKIRTNQLSFLMKKHLNTKMIPQVQLSHIDDFPIISQTDMTNKIFFGKFQLRESLSYFSEVKKNGIAYEINQNTLKKLTNNDQLFKESKIIAIEITSRHKRSEIKQTKQGKKNDQIQKYRTKYKVFIEYIPNKNEPESIKCNF